MVDPVNALAQLARQSMIAVLALVLVVTTYQLLTGRMLLNGLLADKQTGALSAGRVQLLTVVLIGVFYSVIGAPHTDNEIRIAPEFLAVLAGSEGVYLLGKLQSHQREQGER